MTDRFAGLLKAVEDFIATEWSNFQAGVHNYDLPLYEVRRLRERQFKDIFQEVHALLPEPGSRQPSDGLYRRGPSNGDHRGRTGGSKAKEVANAAAARAGYQTGHRAAAAKGTAQYTRGHGCCKISNGGGFFLEQSDYLHPGCASAPSAIRRRTA